MVLARLFDSLIFHHSTAHSYLNGRCGHTREHRMYEYQNIAELLSAVSKPSFSRLHLIELQKYLTWFVRTDIINPGERKWVTHYMARRVGVQPLRSAWMSVAHGALSPLQLATYAQFIKDVSGEDYWLYHGLLKVIETSSERAYRHHVLLLMQPNWHCAEDDRFLLDLFWLANAKDSYGIQ